MITIIKNTGLNMELSAQFIANNIKLINNALLLESAGKSIKEIADEMQTYTEWVKIWLIYGQYINLEHIAQAEKELGIKIIAVTDSENTLLHLLTELQEISEKYADVEIPEHLERSVAKLRKKIEFLKKRAEQGIF